MSDVDTGCTFASSKKKIEFPVFQIQSCIWTEHWRNSASKYKAPLNQ